MKITLDKAAIMPTRAHKTDAGLDLYIPYDLTIFPSERVFVNTGVHIELRHKTVGYIRSRSGLLRDKGLITDGVIDEGYTGPIGVTLINTSGKYVDFKRGDKIAQLVIQPVIYEDVFLVDDLDDTERGENGFGSTGA